MSLFRNLQSKLTKVHSSPKRLFSTQIQALKPSVEITQKKLFIGGDFVDSVSGKTFPTIDPRTGLAICQIAEADAPDVDKAVNAARKAFDEGPWPRMGGFERSRLIHKLADLIEQNKDTLAQIETWDNGKPLAFANVDMDICVSDLRYMAGWADKIQGKTIPMNTTFGQFHCHTYHEPIGVVGAVIPWNFPLLMAVDKIAGSLATGCTIVVKTAETTSLSALHFAKLVQEAGIPEGVINFVPGFGETAGAALSSHRGIDKVTFTGETGTGRLIMKAAAENLIPVSLELGGKSPSIVFSDCDMEEAVKWHDIGVFLNAGQCCCASSRIYVDEKVYDEFVEKAAKTAKARKVGDPFAEGTDQGPQQNEEQFKKVLRYMESGKKEGASLVLGGNRIGDEGFYCEPTIFGDVKDDMQISREEIFGPVMQVAKFDERDVDGVIRRANDTTYGLAAGVFTKDIDKANHVTRALKAGTVWVNCFDIFSPGTPFGGYKQSGIGRERSEYALESFTQIKAVVQNLPNTGGWY